MNAEDRAPDETLWIDEYCESREKPRRYPVIDHAAEILFVLLIYAVLLPFIASIFRGLLLLLGWGDIATVMPWR